MGWLVVSLFGRFGLGFSKLSALLLAFSFLGRGGCGGRKAWESELLPKP